jgi:cell division protease FtsH
MRRLLALTATIFLIAAPAAHADDATASSDAAKAHADEGMSFTGLLHAADQHRILRAELDEPHGRVTVTLRGGEEQTVSYPVAETDLATTLARSGATVYVAQPRGSVPWPLLAALVLGLPGLVLMIAFATRGQRRAAGGRAAGGGTLRRDAQVRDVPAVGFGDVAGCDEAVEELSEILDFLREPERFLALGAKLPSGVILHGPPGTGKTLLAKAVAGDAGVPFFGVSGSEFVERYVGVGASRVRELFARARAQAGGAVIFIDEIDSIGRHRSGGDGGTNQESEQTLNQILVELDGFNGRERIICIAATNRLDILDDALLRPGRFGLQIRVDAPNEAGRLAILELHTRGKPLAENVDLPALARITAGSSGAQLADMVNQAAIMAARERRTAISHADLKEGHLRVLAGPKKQGAMMAEGELEVIAYHEAGHVLTAELAETHEKAHGVSVEPRGRAVGIATSGREDRALHNVQYVHEQMVCALGGRAAEQIVFGHVSSGASNDLEHVNQLARQAVEQLGFSARVGQIVSQAGGRRLPVSEATRGTIDGEVERIVADAYREALTMLSQNRVQLDRLAQALQEQKTLERVDITMVLEGVAPLRHARPRQRRSTFMGDEQPRLRALPGGRSEQPAAPRRDESALVALARWWGARPKRRSGIAA